MPKRLISIQVFVVACCLVADAGRAEGPQNTRSILDLISSSQFDLSPPFAGEKQPGIAETHPSKSLVLLNLGENGLTVKTQYIEKRPGDGLQSLSMQAQTQGQLKALATSSLIDRLLTAEGELAYGSFNPKSLDGLGEQQHRLLRFGVKGAWSDLAYGAEYRSAGKDFTNLAGPGVAGDQEGGELWAQQKFGMVSVKAFLSEFTNNVAQDPAIPRSTKMQGGTTVNIAPPSWPVVSLFYSRGSLASSQEPADFRPQRGSLEFAGASIQYRAPVWQATLSSTYSLSDIRSRPGKQDTVSATSSLADPLFASSRVRTDTPLFSLGLTYRLPDAPVQANAFGSYSKTKASDGYTNTSAFKLSASLIWNLGQSVVGKTALSVGTTYNRNLNAIDPGSSQKDFSAWVLLKLAAF